MDILAPLALPVATVLMLASAMVIHNYRIPAAAAGIHGLFHVLGIYISDIRDVIQAHLDQPEKIVDSLARILETLFMINVRQTKEEQMNGSVTKPFSQPRQTRTEKFNNPPAHTAAVALILFILSAQYVYEARQADRYQKRFLYTGLIFGFNASVIAWMISPNDFFAFKTFMPASVAASLVLSSSAHRFIIPKVAEQEKKEQ